MLQKGSATTNFLAAGAVAEILRSTLGPKSMLKMLIDPMGGIVLTNDGHVILREIDVSHPAAKSVIEVARAQDEEAGDGTSSAIIILGEILNGSTSLLADGYHPARIVSGLLKALDVCFSVLQKTATPVDLNNSVAVMNVIQAGLSAKTSFFGYDSISQLSLDAIRMLSVKGVPSQTELRKFVKVEKIIGGDTSDSEVVKGCVVDKDVVHPTMRRQISRPRIVLLDCPLEYKKGESQTRVEVTSEQQWESLLREEEEEIRSMCDVIQRVGCDLVVTEKGVSDLAAHFLKKAGISVLRRVKKAECNRIARASGAAIVNRVDELAAHDVGHRLDEFLVRKIGDEYYSFFLNSSDPGACSVVMRGGSKDVLNEMERVFHDALSICRNLCVDARVVPGGGAMEVELKIQLAEAALKEENELDRRCFTVLGDALLSIPRVLASNCGLRVAIALSELEDLHRRSPNQNHGVGENGVTDISQKQIYDVISVKTSAIRIAVDAACSLLRIDQVLGGRQSEKS